MSAPAAIIRPMKVSHRAVFAIALPMTLAHMTTPLIGLADAAVIGQLGDPALLGAVAISAILFDILFWGFGFLRMGTAGLTAQALGAEDRQEQRAVLVRALIMAVGLGLALIVLQRPIAWVAFPAFGGSTAVTEAAETYFSIRILAAPLAFINYAVLGWLIGIGRTDLGLYLQIFINLANIAFNVLLTLGLGWGIAGVAWGTVIGEGLGVIAGLAIVARLIGRFDLPRSVILDTARFWRMAAINRDIMIRTLALLVAFAFFTRQGALAGDVTLAANGVLQNLFLVGGYFLDGLATAAEQLCGRAVGANNRAAFRRSVSLALVWGIGFAVVASLALWLAGDWLIALLTTSPEVRATANAYLVFAALTPLAGVHAFTYDGVYVGATWNVAMRNLMFAALAVYFTLWWALTPLGNTGLWLAILGFLAMRGLGQGLMLPRLERRTFAGL